MHLALTKTEKNLAALYVIQLHMLQWFVGICYQIIQLLFIYFSIQADTYFGWSCTRALAVRACSPSRPTAEDFLYEHIITASDASNKKNMELIQQIVMQ